MKPNALSTPATTARAAVRNKRNPNKQKPAQLPAKDPTQEQENEAEEEDEEVPEKTIVLSFSRAL